MGHAVGGPRPTVDVTGGAYVRGMLLAQRCPVCGSAAHPTARGGGCGVPCVQCLRTLSRARDVAAPPGVDVCRCLLDYEGLARHVVSGIKYRNDRRVLPWMAAEMAALLVPPQGCLVTWAPTTAAHRRSRGFDQAELLARAVARRWRVPCRRLLRRPPQPAQTGRSRTQRQHGAVVLAARRGQRVIHPVIIIDDVLTTGATLNHAAQALRVAGAPWVGALTAARTP